MSHGSWPECDFVLEMNNEGWAYRVAGSCALSCGAETATMCSVLLSTSWYPNQAALPVTSQLPT